MSHPAPEFSRPVQIDTLGHALRTVGIAADAAEREALARRFGLAAIHRLEAEIGLTRDGDEVRAAGLLHAAVTQSCVVSGEPVEAVIDAPFALLFRPESEASTSDEVELAESDCDMVFYAGASIDVGEAAAETLALSLDPFPRAADAEEALRKAGVKGEAEVGPFAALAGLKEKLKR